MKLKPAKRVSKVKELIFREFDKLRKDDENFIDLSRGLPIGLPPKEVVEFFKKELEFACNHVYTDARGLKSFREKVASLYKSHFNINVDPETEIQILMGGKDGLSNIVQAFCEEGDSVIVPDPCFPAYYNAVEYSGAEIRRLKLTWDEGYKPTREDLESILEGNEKLMFVNYPHSPTGAVCSLKDFEMMVDFAKKHNIILCYDGVYRDICSFKHPTLLQVKGAMDCSVAISSLSKTFDMCGWRIAYMVGNKDIISKVKESKSVFDVGQFVPIQSAASFALDMEDYVQSVSDKYMTNLDIAKDKAKKMGLEVFDSRGAFFLWMKVPNGFKNSYDFIKHVYDKANLLLMPGVGFGDGGEGYFRISLTYPIEKVLEGLDRLKSLGI